MKDDNAVEPQAGLGHITLADLYDLEKRYDLTVTWEEPGGYDVWVSDGDPAGPVVRVRHGSLARALAAVIEAIGRLEG